MAARQKEACTLELTVSSRKGPNTQGKAGRHYNEDIIAAYHPPGVLERLLAHLHQSKLSSVFMMVGDVQTPVTYESKLSVGVGAAVDSSRTKARLFVNWRARLVQVWVFRRDRRGRPHVLQVVFRYMLGQP